MLGSEPQSWQTAKQSNKSAYRYDTDQQSYLFRGGHDEIIRGDISVHLTACVKS